MTGSGCERRPSWVGTGQETGTELPFCERELIHIPGAIQPHGALLGVQADTGLVTHASANLAAILGRAPEMVLGRPLENAIGEAAAADIMREGTARSQIQRWSGPNGDVLDLQSHRLESRICLDIEPAPAALSEQPLAAMIHSVLENFQHAANRDELSQLAVRGLREISGYDRVMMYRFGEGGHGQVIAEARAAQLEPYLGLCYPATDVPERARRLYLRQRVGSIADASYLPVPLLVDPKLDDGTPLDLTHSGLRSASPVHREYMRNMGTAASLTIGLAQRQELWGMLVCHHSRPRAAGVELRAAAGVIGQVVSLLLSSLGQSEVADQRLMLNDTLRAMIDKVAAPIALLDAFASSEAELLRLVAADGAIVRLSGRSISLGRVPPGEAGLMALSRMQAIAAGEAMAIEDLSLCHPDLATCKGSGALLLPLAPDTDDAIVWFRPELLRDVFWGGDPAKPGDPEQLGGQISPRKSFGAWKQIVGGRSAPWRETDLALARELRVAVAAELAQRARAELAHLRNYDALTGLPNRRMLLDHLAELEANTGPGASAVALLFLDLDRFKAVNDTLGHAAGDALLVQVAERLLITAGPENMVARLGGDEFVVLCQRLAREAVIDLSENVRLVIEAPFAIAGRQCEISVSVGVAYADELAGLDLLRAADMAMYAAKESGRNRGVVFEHALYDRVARQFELEQDLRVAVSRDDQLLLVYQPIFSVALGNRVVGVEARLRWQHPREGLLMPPLFINFAETSGLMLPLGSWILREALHQFRQFRALHPEPELSLSVNISPLQLRHPTFCADLAGMLRSEGVPATSLCLEVTEGVLADTATAPVMNELRKFGVHVALDDFGMAYPSLAHLRRLPVDIVKLDRSFLLASEGDVDLSRFIGALVGLVHAAGLSVVAKGIETAAQLAAVSNAGADAMQGFFLAPPLSARAAAALLARPDTAETDR